MTPQKRLELISAIYNYVGRSERRRPSRSYASRKLHMRKEIGPNLNREHPIAWDMCQIFAAIAGNYRIELSPHYKGVQRIRKNKNLWAQVSQFVVRKVGQGCLPHDTGALGDRWKQLYGGKAVRP